jgi:hypothetical protein
MKTLMLHSGKFWGGIEAGVVIVGFGLRLLWRGITVHRGMFGDDPLVPRWLWITCAGISIAFGLAVIGYIVWVWQGASG